MKRKYSAALVILFWACHNPSTSSNTSAATTTAAPDTVKHARAKQLAKGMTDTVVCSDPSQKYAVYLPSNYDSKKRWPIIYFFDPHGVGNLPLRLYKDLAEKYGYIIAGTYNSKNGMQWPESEKAAQAMMQDSWDGLSIDNSRMYTFGFSGGSRVASSVALYDGGIAGVICCGGAFAERSPNFKTPFSFFGFVGEKDFNYTEMKAVDKELDGSPLPHQLVVYHGKHQWPPAAVAEQAFQWLELNAMKLKTIPKNDSLVKAVTSEFLADAKKQKSEIEQYFTYKKLVNYLSGISDVSEYSSKMNELAKTDKVKSALDNEENNLQQEAQTQQAYINYLSDKDLDWWTSDISKIKATIKKDSLSAEGTQDQRLLSYLSLATYMGAMQAYRAGNSGAMAHFLELYKMVDPTNPEHSYLYAYIYAHSNSNDKAIASLEDAVKLGFTDVKRMQNDSNFVALKDLSAFKDLVKKIENAPPKIDVTQ